jgi:hypothetical protein
MTTTSGSIQKEFLEIISYFNDVIMTNKIIVSSHLQKKFQEEKNKENLDDDAPADTTTITPLPWNNDNFYTYIFRKNKDIQNDLRIYNRKLNYFYIYNKRVYEVCSVILIVLSSLLSLVEGIALCFDPVVYTTISTLIMSMMIGILTSVLKFFNFKNETEEIVKIKEKVHICSAKVFTFDKKLKSHLFLKYNTEPPLPPELQRLSERL